MRKAQKMDILDMIQTLHEAHEEIKNHIDRNNTISAQDLQAQCQECAVSIGNAIETMEKKDCITISYIQDYCDLVYQIYEALQNNTDSNANKIYKNLKKQLLRIENSVKNDIPVRKSFSHTKHPCGILWKVSIWQLKKTRNVMLIAYRFHIMTETRIEALDKCITKATNIQRILK